MELTQILFPIALSFAFVLMVMPLFIGYFQAKKQGQMIRDDGPVWHSAKSGTPTMGGVVFLWAILFASLIIALWKNALTSTLLVILFILVLYGLLGFLDDFIKIFKRRNMGLNSKQKLIGQIVGGVVFCLILFLTGFDHTLYVPLIGKIPLGLFYSLFAIFWLVGFSNAVNLTDGLDGLVSGLGIISFGAYGMIAWMQNQVDILIICLTTCGGLIGFFVYNKKPAKIFMGDVGSLALGGMLAAISIALKQEWTLLLIGFVYVVETASVMLQVSSFKLTGKRIFKMSPIHHHFEMVGWSEWKIDIVFWIVGLVMAGIVISILI